MDRSFRHSTAVSNPTLVGIRGVPVEQTCIHESMLMSLEIRLINRALRASSSSSESQELNGSGRIKGELVEVAAWLEVASVIGVSSLAEAEIVAVEGAAGVSKSIVLTVEGAVDKGAIAEVTSFSFSCSFSAASSFFFSFSFSFITSYNKIRNGLRELF